MKYNRFSLHMNLFNAEKILFYFFFRTSKKEKINAKTLDRFENKRLGHLSGSFFIKIGSRPFKFIWLL